MNAHQPIPVQMSEAEVNDLIDHVTARLRSTVASTVRRELHRHQSNQAAVKAVTDARWDHLDGGLAKAVAEVVAAYTVLENDKYTMGEKTAQVRLDRALASLRTEYATVKQAKERNAR